MLLFNRRKFLSGIVWAGGVSLIAFPEIGCTQQEVAQLTQVLGTDSANVAAALGNSSLAAQITTATTAAVTAITNWTKGSASQMAIEALGILLDDLNLIPIATPYVALIDIAIATAQSLLALLPPPAVVVANQVMKMHKSRTVYLGYAPPQKVSDFQKRWNAKEAAIAAANPTLQRVKSI